MRDSAWLWFPSRSDSERPHYTPFLGPQPGRKGKGGLGILGFGEGRNAAAAARAGAGRLGGA